jgi:bacillithiol biosynthesis deacetylase BshB1
MKLDALFFAAHPDDVELSCGGTAAKLVKTGRKVGIIDLTMGELGTRGTIEIRRKESNNAGKILNVLIRENLEIRDGNIENNEVNRLKIITTIRKYQPVIIFIPYHNDRHPDHQNANKLIRESAFYSGLQKIKTTLNGKNQPAFRPARNYYFMQTYTFEPSFIVDITNEFETKMKAIKCYSSQFYNPKSKEPETFISDKKFIEFLEARAKHYGFLIGVKYGEPYFMEDKLKLDINNLFES